MLDSYTYTVTVVGAGALGSALVVWFKKKGIRIVSVVSSKESFFSEDDGIEWANSLSDLNRIGDLCFLTVPDDSLSSVTKEVMALPIKPKLLVHCSGSQSLDVLSASDMDTAAWHPLQTFNKESYKQAYNPFQGIFSTVVSDSDLGRKTVLEISKQLGSNCLVMDEKHKAILHLAATIACNYLVTNMSVVEEVLNEVEIKPEVLKPLVLETVNQVYDKGSRNALSGPLKRGDVNSIKKHLTLLGEMKSDTLHYYSNLGKKTLDITSHPEKLKNLIKKLLEDEG